MFRPRDSHDLRVLATDLDVSPDCVGADDPGPALELGRAGPAAHARRQAARSSAASRIEHAHTNNLELPLSPSAELLSVRLHARGALRPRALPAPVPRRSRRRAHRLGAPVHPHRRTDRNARPADRDEPAHPRQLALPRRATRKERRARPRRSKLGQRLVPRLRAADDGSRRAASASRRASSRATCTTRRSTAAATASIVGAGYTHAWLQAYLPGAGWVPFDPTNNLLGGTPADPRRHRPRPVAGGADLGQLVRRERRLPRHDGQRDGPAPPLSASAAEAAALRGRARLERRPCGAVQRRRRANPAAWR